MDYLVNIKSLFLYQKNIVVINKAVLFSIKWSIFLF
mgnify:FL=1